MTNPAWITHLLRTIFANSGVECILRAKTLQLHLWGRWKDPRKIETVPSPCPVLDEVSWQIATTARRLPKRHGGSWVEPLPIIRKWKLNGSRPWATGNHNNAGTPGWSPPASTIMHSSVGMRLHDGRMPPAARKTSRSFTSFQMFDTHAHPPAGGWEIKVRAVKWKWKRKEMKMRWRWEWDENYLTRTRRGERKRRGKEKAPTQWNLARSGQTLKGQGKKSGGRRTQNKTSGGGEDGSAWTNPEPT